MPQVELLTGINYKPPRVVALQWSVESTLSECENRVYGSIRIERVGFHAVVEIGFDVNRHAILTHL